MVILMESSKSKYLIVVGGPTGVGKTELAIALALYYPCDIINADSRQVYRELNIGVNKPTPDQMNKISHHLVGHVSIHDSYNAGKYEVDVLKVLDALFKKNDIAILVGGTGLYIKSVLYGLDEFPEVTEEIKAKVSQLYQASGIEGLQKIICEIDPEYYNIVDQKNYRRLSRALEVYYSTSVPYSIYRKHHVKQRPFYSIPIFITDERINVYNKINRRVDEMIRQGLPSEVESLLPYRNLKSLETVGYREWWDFFDGKVDKAHVIDKIKQHTRNYAKRQWTWWNPLHWKSFNPNQIDDMIKYINESINNKD